MPHTLEELERAFEALVAAGRTAFTLRMRRALSWLRRAREAGDDDDVAFICLWIAFNAAYAQDLHGLSEKDMHSQFISRICNLDDQGELYALLCSSLRGRYGCCWTTATCFSLFGISSMTRRRKAIGKSASSRRGARPIGRWGKKTRQRCC